MQGLENVWGPLKMRNMKMQELKMQHKAGSEGGKCRNGKNGKRKEWNAVCNLFVFLGHLQGVTQDTEAEVARVNRGMSIRCSNLLNDARIKACISRCDNGTYTPSHAFSF